MYKHLKQNKYDLIQVNGTPQFKGAIAGKIARTPVLWVLEDTHMPLPIRVLFHLIAKLCADTIVCVGQKVSNQNIKGRLINKKHYEIHAPVNTNIFDPKNVIGKIYIKSTNTIKIGIVAGISKVKGIEYFINMGETICKQYNDIEFFIAGGSLNSQNRYNNKIKSLVDKTKYSKRFHFLGFVEDIPKFLKSMDICVFTSITEASPTAIWEALSMEKPVVTTDVGSVRQYIVDGVSGFVVPTGDVISLSSKVSFFIENKEIAEKIGKAGRTVAIESLDVSVAAKNYYKAYRDTIDTKN